jgi:hypothetical protein
MKGEEKEEEEEAIINIRSSNNKEIFYSYPKVLNTIFFASQKNFSMKNSPPKKTPFSLHDVCTY